MNSPLSFRLRFLGKDGLPVEAPNEWEEAYIEIVEAPGNDTHYVGLWINDQKCTVLLHNDNGLDRVLAVWPPSSPGWYDLRLVLGGVVEKALVKVQTRKLSESQLSLMLDDLYRVLPASIALGLGNIGGRFGTRQLPTSVCTWAQKWLRLRRAVLGTSRQQGLIRILHALADHHHHVLALGERWVPTDRARRPSAQHLHKAYAKPSNLTVRRAPVQVLDSVVEHSVDTYENRFISAYLRLVQREAARFVWELRGTRAAGEADARFQAHKLIEELRKARLHARFLDSVQKTPISLWNRTQVLAKQPLYRAALRGYLEFCQSRSIYLHDGFPEAPMRQIPTLYELWGALRVLDVLRMVLEQKGYAIREHSVDRKTEDGLCVGISPGNHPVLVAVHPIGGHSVRFMYKPHYHENGTIRSRSNEQVPDISVEIFPDGELPTLCIFDTKYRLKSESDEPHKDDIDMMHAYSHAICDHADRSVVKFAGIIYPGRPIQYPSDTIEAISGLPDTPETLRQRVSTVLHRLIPN